MTQMDEKHNLHYLKFHVFEILFVAQNHEFFDPIRKKSQSLMTNEKVGCVDNLKHQS